jgi:hypothetical protein
VLQASQAAAGNYTAGTQNASYTVAQATQTITFTAPTSPVTYGVSPITLVATGGASGNTVVFSVVSGPGTISGTTLTITGVGTVVVAANQAGNTNYSAATQVTQTVVSRATLTVTANNASRVVGAANPAFSVSYSGFVNGDTAATALTGSPALTTAATSSSPAGNYPIAVSQGTLSAANYTFAFVNGTLSVLASPTVAIAITAAPLTVVSGGYQTTVTIANNGTAPANNVQLTSASLGTAAPNGTPQWNGNLGTLAAGASVTVTVIFPASAGRPGAAVSEKFAGSYTGGTFNTVTYPGGTFTYSVKSTVLP